MKRALAAIVLIAAVFLPYHYYEHSYAPRDHYRRFAEEVLHRRYDAAAAMTDGITPAELEKQGSQEHIGAGPPMFQTLFPSLFTIESHETSADGTLTLHAVQTVRFNPAGVESTRPAMFATLNQTVSLKKKASGWKVTAFENRFASMESIERR